MEAEALVHHLARVHLQRRVEAHRREHEPRRRRPALPGLRRRRSERDDRSRERPVGHDALAEELEAAENRGSLPPRLEAEARALLAREGASLEGEPFEYLCSELLRVEHWARRIVEHERVGVRGGEPRAPAGRGPGGPDRHAARAGSPAWRRKPCLRLSQAIEEFVAWHEGKGWDPKAAGAVKTALARLVEIVGDKALHHVTPEDIERYRRVLERLPSRFGVRYRGRSIGEVLAQRPEPGFSPTSVRRHLSHAHALFDFAEERAWVEGRNPVRGLGGPRQRAGPQGASFPSTRVPAAANMPPTPCASEMRAPGTCAGAVPRS